MSPSQRIVIAFAAGTAILVTGMRGVEEFFWGSCSGVDIHRYHEIWICWNFLNLWLASACAAGLVAGLLGRTRGVLVGTIVAIAGLVFYSVVFRYPFGIDHLVTLKNGLLFFVLPSVVACILGARLTGGVWKNAL